ncbi:MAG: hypothetical protein HZB59_08255 [Ignavibacteriales bacterium]|nr:hypothetical protein [Ignavibacteriales bacterium]
MKRFVILAKSIIYYINGMAKLTQDEIRERFESSKEFNEIFDAFEQAIEQRIDDIELYRLLFWNSALKAEELSLFGEKLAKEFSHISYDVYMWLASVFEVMHSVYDNYELALQYYKKASAAKPEAMAPYLDAADCYEHDLKIPPIHLLIDFLKQGVNSVPEPLPIYEKLAHLYEQSGNDEMSMFYKRKFDEGTNQKSNQPPEE